MASRKSSSSSSLLSSSSSKTKKKKQATPKAYHHGDLRRALLDAARTELKAVGWQELSLRGVARRAGVTHTAAYHHFKDRGALLATIAAEGFAHLDRAMAEAMATAGDDAVDRLSASGIGYLTMAAADPPAYDLMFNGLDYNVDVGLLAGADPFVRLFQAVEGARALCGISIGTALDDAMLHWECVHGAAMLMRSGQLERRGIDFAAHSRAIAERLATLYRPRS